MDQTGVRLGVSGGVLYAAMGLLVAVGVPAGAGVGVLLLLTAACCPVLSRPGALLLGVAGWALATGFLVNALGQLTFAPADLLRLGAYVGTGLWLGGRAAGGE